MIARANQIATPRASEPLGAMTRAEIIAFLDSPLFADAVMADDFEARCVELFRRLDAGENFYLGDVGYWLRLPWPVAGFLLATLAPSYLPPLPGRPAIQ